MSGTILLLLPPYAFMMRNSARALKFVFYVLLHLFCAPFQYTSLYAFPCSPLAILLCLKRSTSDSRRCSEAPKGTPWMLEMKALKVSLNLLSVASPQASSSSVPLNLSCGAGNFGKFWSAREKHEIQCVK